MNFIEHETEINKNIISDEDSEISDSRMCRYCFCEVKDENENYSSCSCRTRLCRECLERELCLTEGRQVCNAKYMQFYMRSTQFHNFIFHRTIVCTAQYVELNISSSI